MVLWVCFVCWLWDFGFDDLDVWFGLWLMHLLLLVCEFCFVVCLWFVICLLEFVGLIVYLIDLMSLLILVGVGIAFFWVCL